MASLESGDPSEVFASKRQRIGDGRAFVTTQQGHAADERDGQCFSSDTTAKGSESCVDVEEESSKVASSSCSWDAAVKAELERYAKSMPGATRSEDAYRPGPMSHHQLCQAAEEFVKRCHDGNDEDFPLVFASPNCNDMPSREFELAALQSSGIGVSKLWYALTKANDLLIVKYASDISHGDALGEVVRCVGNFGVQHGSRGRRPFSWRTYPTQGRPEQLRTSFVAELEYENGGPKALMLQLSEYTLLPVANYVLGIKVYKRSGPPATGGMKRPFAAIALLWRRGAAPPGNLVSFVQAWSFGSCALPPGSKNAFCRRRGNLQQVQPGQITHPQSHTLATDAIVIPNAHLVQGVVDENGNQIPIRPTDNDLTIDLGEIRGFFDDKLPP